MSLYKDLTEVLDQKTVDKTPKEIENILNDTQYRIGSKSIPKMIEELNKKGIKAGKTKGRYEGNAIEVEGQFFEYEGTKNGWKWRSGASNRIKYGTQPENSYRARTGDPSKVDTSKLPSHEEYMEKQKKRLGFSSAKDPLEKSWWGAEGNSGVEQLKQKQRDIEYANSQLERAKADYEKALERYKKDYEYYSKLLAKRIGEKDQFMIEFRKKFGEALRK